MGRRSFASGLRYGQVVVAFEFDIYYSYSALTLRPPTYDCFASAQYLFIVFHSPRTTNGLRVRPSDLRFLRIAFNHPYRSKVLRLPAAHHYLPSRLA